MMWRKRPVEIEAMPLPEVHNIDGRLNFEKWINKRLNGRAARWVGDWLEIETLEGVMKANVGDYVICGVAGELYPCKPHIFYATYERVTQEEQTMGDSEADENRYGLLDVNSGVSIDVPDQGEDYEIRVVRGNPTLGYISIQCTDSDGASAHIPRLSSNDARELAALLTMAADEQDRA